MVRQIGSEIWAIDHPDFKLAPGVRPGTRTTLVRLADGGLWMHSPGPLDEARVRDIEELGPVRFIVAPNIFHHLFLAENLAAWPMAELHLAPGLEAKRPDLKATSHLGSDAVAGWAADLDQCLIEGAPRLSEVVFRHRSSRTLILTDLAFNVGRPENLGARLFFGLTGVLGRFSTSRLIRLLIRDRLAAQRSFEQILSWDFDQVVVSHGEILQTNGPRLLREALTRVGPS